MQETRIKVTELIIRLAAAFPHAKLTEETFDVYAEALQDVPLEILHPALIQAAQDSEFFPTLHRIREVITNILFDGTPTAEEAWEQVMEWLANDCGHPLHPLVARVVKMIGGSWMLRQSDHIGVERGQFLTMYRNLREREREKLTRTPDYKRLQAGAKNNRVTGMRVKEICGYDGQGQSGNDEPPLSKEEAAKFLAEILGGKQIGKEL